MFLFVITVSALLGPILSRPQESPAAAPAPAHAAAAAPAADSRSGSTPIPIISQTEEVNPDGSFKFSYETGNGIKVEESGYLKDGNESSTDKIQVIQGSVSYTDSDGKVINLRYIADENGFQPEGDHLPTPPPLPSAVGNALRALPEQVDSNTAAQPATQAAAESAPQPAVQPAPQAATQSASQPAAAQPAAVQPAAAQPAAAQPTAAQPAAQTTPQPEQSTETQAP